MYQLVVGIAFPVRFKNFLKDTYGDLLKMLKTAPEECAIIYCHSRAACDDIGARLLKDTVPCKGVCAESIFRHMVRMRKILFS